MTIFIIAFAAFIAGAVFQALWMAYANRNRVITPDSYKVASFRSMATGDVAVLISFEEHGDVYAVPLASAEMISADLVTVIERHRGVL